MSFAEQVSLFASCDLLVSVHGSHNANVMWMRPGSAFMEINPHKFFYSSYEQLAAVATLHYLPSRLNEIERAALPPPRLAQAEYFTRKFSRWTDDRCQANGECRKMARNFPTRVNLTDAELHLRGAVSQLRGGCGRQRDGGGRGGG